MNAFNDREMDRLSIKNATIEAIYWWNRTEHYYHQYFSQLDKIYQNKELLKFFKQKLFKVFLREYYIRRNLSAGDDKIDSFLNELIELNFINQVKNGKVEIVDSASYALSNSEKSTTNSIVSLLSKVAFLINPSAFSLYDSLTRESLWKIFKPTKTVKHKDLKKYSFFIRQIEVLKEQIESKGLFKLAYQTLNKFRKTEAYNFFQKQEKAFQLRVIDKYLWVEAQKRRDKYIDNSTYKKFLKL